jgi:hypothetical protein
MEGLVAHRDSTKRKGFDSLLLHEPVTGQSSLTCWKKRKKSKKDAGRAVRRGTGMV